MAFGQAVSRAAFGSSVASSANSTFEAGIKPAVKLPGVAGLVAAALTLTGVGSALTLTFASGGNRDQAAALLSAVPRTCRALGWVARSLLDYSAVKKSFPELTDETYRAALDEVHRIRATALLDLCQKNGSLYIKAAQQLTLVPAIPKLYRTTEFCRVHIPK